MRFNIDKTKEGFTLIETIVTITLSTLVMGVVVSSIQYFYFSNRYTVEQSGAVRNAQKGVLTLVGDIREAHYSDEGAFPLVSVGSTTITFYSDTDDDDVIERMRYYLDGDTLMRGVQKSSGDPPIYSGNPETLSTVANYVRNEEQDTDIFEYYNAQGDLVTDYTNDITDIVFVRISLIVNVNPTLLPNELTLRSSASIRNLIQ